MQLYKPQHLTAKLDPDESEVWKWWSQCLHVKYPSSLYITVEPVNPPEVSKVENILKGSLDSIPSPSPSVKIHKVWASKVW